MEAQGEVAALKDNINEMIRNLKDTTQKNTEQDWLKTNLAKFTRMLQGQRDLEAVAQLILSELAPLVSAQHGVFYMMDAQDAMPRAAAARQLRLPSSASCRHRFGLGEGLVGQCALEKQTILLTDVPRDYIAGLLGPGRGAADQHRRAADRVREAGARR